MQITPKWVSLYSGPESIVFGHFVDLTGNALEGFKSWTPIKISWRRRWAVRRAKPLVG